MKMDWNRLALIPIEKTDGIMERLLIKLARLRFRLLCGYWPSVIKKEPKKKETKRRPAWEYANNPALLELDGYSEDLEDE